MRMNNPYKKPPSFQKRERERQKVLETLAWRNTTSKNQSYTHYLVQWKGKPPTKATWISKPHLESIDTQATEEFKRKVTRSWTNSLQSEALNDGSLTQDLWVHLVVAGPKYTNPVKGPLLIHHIQMAHRFNYVFSSEEASV